MPAGPGGVDSNGVYLYGESDAASPVSDMLNLGLSSVSTQLTNDRSRLTNLETTANNPNVFVAASATARDAKYGNPATLTATQRKALQDLGVLVYRTDLGITERFWAVYNATTNTIGAAQYGWYPVNGGSGAIASRNNTSLSIPNATWTVVTCNRFATNGVTLNSTTTPSIFTVLYNGFYRISLNAAGPGWSSGAGTYRAGIINRNNTNSNTNLLAAEIQTGGISTYGLNLMVDVGLAANDQLRFWLNQDSGGAATNSATHISIDFLRPSQV
jgi:hypothetical protein